MAAVTLLTALPPLDDPWHDFAATSLALRELLEARGDVVTEPGSVDEVAATLASADVFVANCSADQYADAPEFPVFAAALGEFVTRGGAILSMHASLLAFQRVPQWGALLGCRWIHPVSMHPQKGWALVQVGESPSSITRGMSDFTVYDEKYSRLELAPDIAPLLFHITEGSLHPLLWQREVGAARVVVDALGHGLDSYDSPRHRDVISRSLDWLANRAN